MTGINTSKLSGAHIIGPPKGVNVVKLSGAQLIGPPTGINVVKLSGALIAAPVGSVVFNLGTHVRTRPYTGADIFNLATHVRARQYAGADIFNLATPVRMTPPRTVFRAKQVSGYASIIFAVDPKFKGFQAAAFAALKPPAEFIKKTTAYVSLERVELLARKVLGGAVLEPASSRVKQVRGFAALSTFPFFLRAYAATKYATLKYMPPLGVYSMNLYAALKVRPPIITFRVGASAAIVEPRIHVKILNLSVTIEAHRARVPVITKYVTLQPRPFEMFPRKIAGYASVAGPPPMRVDQIGKYAAIAFPDPVIWVWKAKGFATLQALQPVKVQQLNKYLTVSVPPPVFTYRVGGYVTVTPKPTGMLPFKVSAAVALASDPPHLFQMSGAVTLVPLGSIGERTKKTALYATLTPGAPVASTQYPILVVT